MEMILSIWKSVLFGIVTGHHRMAAYQQYGPT